MPHYVVGECEPCCEIEIDGNCRFQCGAGYIHFYNFPESLIATISGIVSRGGEPCQDCEDFDAAYALNRADFGACSLNWTCGTTGEDDCAGICEGGANEHRLEVEYSIGHAADGDNCNVFGTIKVAVFKPSMAGEETRLRHTVAYDTTGYTFSDPLHINVTQLIGTIFGALSFFNYISSVETDCDPSGVTGSVVLA